jgi:hypothetical protein
MSKASSVVGRACSGLASRSFHPYWQEVSPVHVGPTRIDTVNKTWEFIKDQAKARQKTSGKTVWINGKAKVL